MLDELHRVFGMEVQVRGNLPPGSVFVVSPDVMQRLRLETADRLMWAGLPFQPALFKSGLSPLLDSIRSEREENARRARFEDQRKAWEWDAFWWHGGRNHGWWEQ